jgi:lysophospholipase L1-like esterase
MKLNRRHPTELRYSLVASSAVLISCATVQAAEFKFDFGSGTAQLGYTQVTPQMCYDAKRGFGYLGNVAVVPDKPSMFEVDAAEGNYDVTIRFGSPAEATSTTVKAESRRLVVGNVATAPGQYVTRTFTVNVRRPTISTGGAVDLKPREAGLPDWDDHLSFEFNGKHAGVASMEIQPTENAITVFIAGDSTVTDQPREPWAGWGQMLPCYFQQGVAVSNNSWSGLTLTSFEHQKRLDKILSTMKQGDYLFIQFGHNDQKEKSEGAGPFTTYKANLKRYIGAARSKGGIPVLVSPMERRRFEKDGSQTPTLADYAEAVRQVGAEEKVPVVDLNAMSLKFYGALGPDKSTKAFVYYPAHSFPGQDKELKDNTHHSNYGAYELARCVVEGIKANVPDLAAHLNKDVGPFDPSSPDPLDNVNIPASPAATGALEKPEGS